VKQARPLINRDHHAEFRQILIGKGNQEPETPSACKAAVLGQDESLTCALKRANPNVALGYPWPSRYPERVLRNEFWERWAGREDLRSADLDALSELVAAGDKETSALGESTDSDHPESVVTRVPQWSARSNKHSLSRTLNPGPASGMKRHDWSD